MKNQNQSRWIKVIVPELQMRAVVIHGKDLIRTLTREVHELEGASAERLGEAALGALLIGSNLKPTQRLNLRVEGLSSRTRVAIVDTHYGGKVRGYLVERDLTDEEKKEKRQQLEAKKSSSRSQVSGKEQDTPKEPNENHLSDHLNGPWGVGNLTVLRSSDRPEKVPYSGTVPLLTGHLAKDLTFYLHQSEQIPSAVGLKVSFEKNEVQYASGFMIQALPGADKKQLAKIEDRIHEFHDVFHQLNETQPILKALAQIFNTEKLSVIDELKLQAFCTCGQGKVENAMTFLQTDELKDILKNEGSADVTCDFCKTHYRVSEAQLEAMIQERTN